MWTTNKTIERLENGLRELKARCDDLERAKRNQDLEFTELYDKVRHQMSRMARRDAHAQKETPIVATSEPVNSTYSNMDPISQSIMLRRAGIEKPVE